MSEGKQCRFGIMGCGFIADVIASAAAQAKHAVVTACASRSEDKAKAFAAKHKLPRWFSSYDDMVNDKELDALYITLPTATRTEWVIKALEAGKHVLIEKPLGTVKDCEQIAAAAAKHQGYIMDGTHWVHHTRAHEIRAALDKHVLGDVVKMFATFNWPWAILDDLSGNVRGQVDAEPTGALGDVGWYPAAALVFYLGQQDPAVEVLANLKYRGKVIVGGTLMVNLKSGAHAVLDFGFPTNALQQSLEISGRKGVLTMSDAFFPWKNAFALPTDEKQRDPEDWQYVIRDANPLDSAGQKFTGKGKPLTQHVAMLEDFAKEAALPAKERAERAATNAAFFTQVTRILNAALESGQERKWVPVQ